MDASDPPDLDEDDIDTAVDVPRRDAPRVVRERRSAPRRKLALVVTLCFASIDDVFESETLDISRAGVFLRTTEIRPEGTPVRVTLCVGGRDLVLHGTIVRVIQPPLGKCGLGVAFDHPVVDDSGLFDALLEAKWARGTSDTPRRGETDC